MMRRMDDHGICPAWRQSLSKDICRHLQPTEAAGAMVAVFDRPQRRLPSPGGGRWSITAEGGIGNCFPSCSPGIAISARSGVIEFAPDLHDGIRERL